MRGKEWVLNVMLGAPMVLLFTFTAVRYPLDLDFLLPLFTLFCALGLFASTAIRWGLRQVSSSVALAGCGAGVLLMVYGGIELSVLPIEVRRVVRVVIPLLLLLVMAYWWRVGRQSAE